MNYSPEFSGRLKPIHEIDQTDRDTLTDIAEIPETSDAKLPGSHSSINFDVSKDNHVNPRETDTFLTLLRQHTFEVFVYCAVFFSFGQSVAFLGPTILDLGCQTNTDLKHMSWVFFVQLFMTLIGSISSGFLSKIFSGNAILTYTTMGIPVIFFLLPWCSSMLSLLTSLAVMGWCMGCVDSLANLQMLRLYGSKVTPFLQLMYFCYGFGAFLSPMIAEPFLLNNDCSPYIDGYSKTYKVSELARMANMSLEGPLNISVSRYGLPVLHQVVGNTSNALTTSSPDEVSVTVPPDLYMLYWAKMKTEIRFAFYILGGLQIPIPFLVLYLYWKIRRYQQKNAGSDVPNNNVSYGSTDGVNEQSESSKPKGLCTCAAIQSKQIFSISLLASFLRFLFDGLESSYSGFIYTFAIKRVKNMNEKEGATINASFWGVFAFGRLLSVFLAMRLTSSVMLLGNIIGCCAAAVILLIFNTNRVFIYISTSLLGLFISSCSPTVFSLTEQYIDVESSITSMLVVMAASGEMVFPVVIGHLFVNVGTITLPVVSIIILVVSLLLYICFVLLGTKTKKWKEGDVKNFIWLPGYDSVLQPERISINSTKTSKYRRMQEETANDSNDLHQTVYEMGSMR